MNIADSLKKIQGKLPSGPNGHGTDAGEKHGQAPASAVKQRSIQSMIVLAPVALAAVGAVLVLRRNAESTSTEGISGASARMSGVAAKLKHRRRRPNNLLRFYGLGVLISALERDSTRKAVILALKWAQKRA